MTEKAAAEPLLALPSDYTIFFLPTMLWARSLRRTWLDSSCLGCLGWLASGVSWDCSHLRVPWGQVSNMAHANVSCWLLAGTSWNWWPKSSLQPLQFRGQRATGLVIQKLTPNHEQTCEQDRSRVNFSDRTQSVTKESHAYPGSRRGAGSMVLPENHVNEFPFIPFKLLQHKENKCIKQIRFSCFDLKS